MQRRLHKLLLVLITLSVAFAPLHGAWALPEAGTNDTESRCAGMQHDSQQLNHHADHGVKSDSKPHKCKSGCNGFCCKQGCSICLHHTTAAIPASLVVLRDIPVHEHGQTVADNFPERHLKPPLRPPLALQ
jgi:hypothetical protein